MSKGGREEERARGSNFINCTFRLKRKMDQGGASSHPRSRDVKEDDNGSTTARHLAPSCPMWHPLRSRVNSVSPTCGRPELRAMVPFSPMLQSAGHKMDQGSVSSDLTPDLSESNAGDWGGSARLHSKQRHPPHRRNLLCVNVKLIFKQHNQHPRLSE